jgi:hypothetical protein
MIRETKVPSIPDIRDDNIKDVLRAIKATLDVREGSIGDPLDQSVTLRDLVDLNIAQASGITDTASGGSLPVTPVIPPINGGYNPNTDYTTPPQPTGLRARGGFSNVFLEWDGAPYRNHSVAQVWRSETDNLGSAIMVGTTAADVYADAANPDTVYFYWIRFVSVANITGPYNQTSGTQARTAIDVTAALGVLSDEIQNSQLFADLGSRIKSVETSQLFSASVLQELQSGRSLLSSELSRTGSAVINVKKITEEQASILTALGTRVGNSESSITTLQTTTANQASSLTALTTRVGTAESSITNLQTTTANQATSISQLTSTVNGQTTSIQTLTTTTNGLSAQYSVKIDNNGHVSGFGLSSTVSNGTPTSAFIVRSDRFAIVGPTSTSDPLGTLTPSKTPFMVFTTPTTVGGKTYPSGTWMDAAFIADATIDTAQIRDLTADKITTGNLTATIGITTGKIQGGVAGYNSGTGFFLGLDASVYKFYVGSSSQNMRWDGSSLNVTGNIDATSGTFRNITIYDVGNNVILNSGGLGAGTVGITQLGATIQTTNFSGTTGWQITTGGAATFNTVALRGAINGGSFTGYAWPASGTGFHLGPNGLLLGNFNTGRYFQVEAAGNVYAPGLSIVDGNATFSGGLSGASGTFSGSLTAQVVNTANIVGAAVTSGFIASSAGSSVQITIDGVSGGAGVTVQCYVGDPYQTSADSTGEDTFFWLATPVGTLYVGNGPAVTSQSGHLFYAFTGIFNQPYTFKVDRNVVSGIMILVVTQFKR